MHYRRTLTGVLLGAAALAAVPSAASASATCTYDSVKHEMKVRYGSADTNLTLRNGQSLQFGEAGGVFRNCLSAAGTAATAANTNKITVVAFSSATGPAAQTTTIDERNGDFSDSNPNLRVSVLTGTGRDRLIVREGAALDAIAVKDQGGLAVGPAVDLDKDGDLDITMTTGFDSVVQLNGGGGADLLDATLATQFQTVLVGEDGNDTLKGGKRNDGFQGGNGTDTIFAQDGNIESVDGGAGADTATVDNTDQLTSVETVK